MGPLRNRNRFFFLQLSFFACLRWTSICCMVFPRKIFDDVLWGLNDTCCVDRFPCWTNFNDIQSSWSKVSIWLHDAIKKKHPQKTTFSLFIYKFGRGGGSHCIGNHMCCSFSNCHIHTPAFGHWTRCKSREIQTLKKKGQD